jgi:Metallopeptidase family M81
MRIAIGGIMHESNTFAAAPTDRRRFEEGSLTRGDAVLPVWRDAHHELGGFIAGAERLGYELCPTAMAWATPAGPVDDAVIDEVVGEIVVGCRRVSADGLLLVLQGAMVSPRYLDADGEVLRRIRAALVEGLPIVATLDYHANVSPAMAENADALVGYQTYPRIDQRGRGLEAAGLIVRAVRGEIRPVVALAKPPVILNLLGQETDREPMRSLMIRAREPERRHCLLTTSLMAGFPYADVTWMGPAVIAVADADRTEAQAVADELAGRMWEARRELFVACPGPEEAVRLAMASDRRPVVLVDLGDNVGGGSAGDGISRTFDDAGCTSPGSVAAVGFLSGRVERPRPLEHESRPAVHLPLDRLQTVHMSLHGAVAPPLRHRRMHRRLVTTDAFGEPAQVRVRRGLTSRQPLGQGRGRLLTDQVGEPVRQLQRRGQLAAGGADGVEPRLFGRLAFLWSTSPLEGELPCRRRPRDRRNGRVEPLSLPPGRAEPLRDERVDAAV